MGRQRKRRNDTDVGHNRHFSKYQETKIEENKM